MFPATLRASISTINTSLGELCRTCLDEADTNFVSINKLHAWTSTDIQPIQNIIEQITNRKVRFTNRILYHLMVYY